MINFLINSDKTISQLFIKNNCYDFVSASDWIRKLEYKRNKNKNDLSTVFADNCGTCSTKHAILKALSEENNEPDFKLVLGIFKMNGFNTPKIKLVLEKYNLDFLPEAHNYLKFKNQILDFTNRNSSENDFKNDLLKEIEIKTNQINDFKINFHQNFLAEWLISNPNIHYNLDEIWKIREECIVALSKN